MHFSDPVLQRKMRLIKDKGSSLTGYAVKTNNLAEVRRAYRRIKLYHPDTDHHRSQITMSFLLIKFDTKMMTNTECNI